MNEPEVPFLSNAMPQFQIPNFVFVPSDLAISDSVPRSNPRISSLSSPNAQCVPSAFAVDC
jgi:hypothetical protein